MGRRKWGEHGGARGGSRREERAARLGEGIIKLAQRIPGDPVNNRLVDQLVGRGHTVGANHCEDDGGFFNLQGLPPQDRPGWKEPKGTKYFLRMVATAETALEPGARLLWQEAKELHFIFRAILPPKRHLRR